MNIEFNAVKLVLSQDEVWVLIFSLQKSINHSVTTHWCNWTKGHTEDGFVEYVLEQENDKYDMFEGLCNLINRREILKDIEATIRESYKNSIL